MCVKGWPIKNYNKKINSHIQVSNALLASQVTPVYRPRTKPLGYQDTTNPGRTKGYEPVFGCFHNQRSAFSALYYDVADVTAIHKSLFLFPVFLS